MATFWLRPFLGVQQCSCKHGIAFTVGVKSPQLRTQSGESGNTLKIKCSGTSDERANIFAVPTTTEAECSSRCSVSYIMPSLTKQAIRKDDSVER